MSNIMPDGRRHYLATVVATAPTDQDRARIVMMAKRENINRRWATEQALKAELVVRVLAKRDAQDWKRGGHVTGEPGDVQELPYPALRPVRSKSDGAPVRNVTKGGQPRTVPMSDDVAAIVFPLIDGRGPNELVFPNALGTFRAENNWKRDSHWDEVKRGRWGHDLRHTFATLALSNGVDIKTVQHWLATVRRN